MTRGCFLKVGDVGRRSLKKNCVLSAYSMRREEDNASATSTLQGFAETWTRASRQVSSSSSLVGGWTVSGFSCWKR